ncbi:MAG: efflux RND transporter permease subunit [Proteobacteria bacterium]|nr:efflux RND transporter permease subunit [Pseudomonadota bacterium]
MIRYFARHPTAANLLMIAFMVSGLFAAPLLNRETFPRVQPNKVEIQVLNPGARAEDVEEAICQRIEDAIDGIDNVDEITCEAHEGRARAVVKMDEGADFDRFTSDVRTEIDAITDFPDQAEDPVVKQLGRTDFVASVAVTGAATKPDLKALAENLKDRMLRFGGIPKIDIKGFADHQIRIELPDAVIRQYGISISDVARAIQRQSLDLPSGTLQTGDQDLLIRVADERKTVNDFRDVIVVAAAGGGQIRLGEIATITDRFDVEEAKTLFNGKPAAILDITKTATDDTLAVIGAVNDFLAHERQVAPPGIEMVITNDISSIVRDRLRLLLTNGGQGLVLVLLVLWLFFGFRYAFWVAAGLPVSFLGAVVLMVAIGYTINMLTMVGLLIVIGLLMDDAIVIAENVATKRAQGLPPIDAAIEGAKQVMPGVFASFATTACIFGSLAFLKGDIGQILRVVPIVMLFVLVISLIEAFLILPHHLAHALSRADDKPARVQAEVGRFIDWLRDRVVGPVAIAAVQWRYLTAGIAVGLMLIAISTIAGGWLKFAAFPELDGNVMEARILLPQGTPLKRTEQVVATITEALARVNERLSPAQPGGQALIRKVVTKFNENKTANETGAHVATITVDLLDSETRSSRIDDVIALWREESGTLADIVSVRFAESQIGPAGLAFDVRLTGDDLNEIKAAARELTAKLDGYRGTSNLTDDLRPGKPELRVRLKDGASTLGIDARQIADQLRAAFFGTTVSEIQRGAEAYEIDVRIDPRNKDSLSDMDNFTISQSDGSLIPLTAIADIVIGRGFSRINRVNGQRTVTVQGDVDVTIANANEILSDTRKNFFPELARQYPGVSISLQGQNKEAQTTQQSMVSGFILGLIGVYLLLSFQFRSYVEPLIVMIIIPFALGGAIAGHLLLGLDFTMPSMLGFVALAGVVVNDSILLVEFIKHYHGDTKSVAKAAPLASQARFRAILLTSLTTIVGLLPLLAETSLQAQVLIPLVTSLAFGLVARPFWCCSWCRRCMRSLTISAWPNSTDGFVVVQLGRLWRRGLLFHRIDHRIDYR